MLKIQLILLEVLRDQMEVIERISESEKDMSIFLKLNDTLSLREGRNNQFVVIYSKSKHSFWFAVGLDYQEEKLFNLRQPAHNQCISLKL